MDEQIHSQPGVRLAGAQVQTELGLLQTAPVGSGHFQIFGQGSKLIFIGIGPNPTAALQAAETHAKAICIQKVFYCEAPAFSSQLPEAWRLSIPKEWIPFEPAELSILLAADTTIAVYQPGLKLFPSFYGPLFAQAQASLFRKNPEKRPALPSKIILVGNERGLLVSELANGLKAMGFELELADPQNALTQLPKIIKSTIPILFMSVNLAGFDPLGEMFYLLEELGIPAASWCVDNPWHLLSGLRSPFWKRMHLFVTDASFINELKNLGAASVHHLPLAASPGLFKHGEQISSLSPGGMPYREPIFDMIFAGRSQFPNRNKFFAAAKIDATLLRQSEKDTVKGERRDFAWWVKKLEISPLWPGQEVRRAGLGAETCSLAWRTAVVRAAVCASGAGNRLKFQIFGNPEWLDHVPELREAEDKGEQVCQLHPPVDYYTALPEIYANSRLILSTTSLLLPAGLNQRHFDAWMAGNICLSDNTPGLDLFPGELTAPITYETPAQLVETAQYLLDNSGLQADLKKSWRALLQNEHTYPHRISVILDKAGVRNKPEYF